MAHAWVLLFGGAVAALLSFAGLTYSVSVAGFIGARFALGIGEAGNFPGAIKTVAEWFPRKERAFATGIFNAGTNIGALLTPLIVPIITTVIWMGMGVHFDGRAGVPLARVVVGDVSRARRASECQQGRARLHPQRSARADDEVVMGPRSFLTARRGRLLLRSS